MALSFVLKLVMTARKGGSVENVRSLVRDRFGEVLRVVAARAANVEKGGEFPHEVLKSYQVAGLMAAIVPEEFGGIGMSHLEFTTLIEEVARYSGALSLLLIVQAVGCLPVILADDFPRRRETLEAVAQEGRLLGFALTEAASGSDAFSMTSEVVEEGGQLYLTGNKHLITNAGQVAAHVVFANARERGLKYVSAYLVDVDRPGFRTGRANRLLGMRGIPTAALHFDRVPLSEQDRIGARSEGFQIAMRALNLSRPWIAAQAIGLAQGALEVAVEFAHGRRVMGESLIDKQGVRFTMADIASRLEAGRALVERTSKLIGGNREDYAAASAMCKLFSTETAMWACERALQLLGSAGCISGNRAERAFRDVKITQIYEGTSEIQRIVVAQEIARKTRKMVP